MSTVSLSPSSAPGERLRQTFQPLWWYALYLSLLCCFYQLVAWASSDSVAWLNVVGPSTLCLVSFFFGYRLVQRNPLAVWTPLPWLLAACGIYFGFGPLVYTFGSDSMIADLD